MKTQISAQVILLASISMQIPSQQTSISTGTGTQQFLFSSTHTKVDIIKDENFIKRVIRPTSEYLSKN